jgi:hypothetical protein
MNSSSSSSYIFNIFDTSNNFLLLIVLYASFKVKDYKYLPTILEYFLLIKDILILLTNKAI